MEERYTRADVARLLSISKDAARHAFERLPEDRKARDPGGTWSTDAEGVELIRAYRAHTPAHPHAHPEAHTPDKSIDRAPNAQNTPLPSVSEGADKDGAGYAEAGDPAPMRTPVSIPAHTPAHTCEEDCAYLRELREKVVALEKELAERIRERDDLRNQYADMKNDRDDWKVLAQEHADTIALQAKTAAAHSVKEIAGKPGLLQRLRLLIMPGKRQNTENEPTEK